MLDRSKMKAHADDKINVNQKLRFVLGRVENILGKGENAGYQHFLIFPQCFRRLLKVVIEWLKVFPIPKTALVFTCLQYKSF